MRGWRHRAARSRLLFRRPGHRALWQRSRRHRHHHPHRRQLDGAALGATLAIDKTWSMYGEVGRLFDNGGDVQVRSDVSVSLGVIARRQDCFG
jgi:hypothetical protein